VLFVFLAVKAAETWRWSFTPFNADVKESVQLHLQVPLWA